ncbi:hypothetical protein [Bacillus smithii]|uniref:hypothetical protein n=1 Tax=Bacillus smithii TaxID=1479 RepID=UPI002E1FFA1E|nr:hypothetical protein [Bacillus smithii]MED4928263.1 hypothetical protein [Bacillus smithii]
MGMFDSFYGEVNCSNCGKKHDVEIQFKWGDRLLNWYELGDYVHKAPDGIYVETDWENNCECGSKFQPSVILRNRQVVAFVNERELKKLDVNKIPEIEENFAKKESYKRDCKNGIGLTQERVDFALQPFKKDEIVVALGSQWKVLEGYKITIDDNSKFALLRRGFGCLSRNQDLWFVYRVYNEKFGYRWLEVEDKRIGLNFRKGNMEVFKNYNFGEEGYLYEKLF